MPLGHTNQQVEAPLLKLSFLATKVALFRCSFAWDWDLEAAFSGFGFSEACH